MPSGSYSEPHIAREYSERTVGPAVIAGILPSEAADRRRVVGIVTTETTSAQRVVVSSAFA